MKNLKNNFKEIWKDTKGLVTSAVSLVVDVVSIPVSACKDIRDAYVNSKTKKEQVEVQESSGEVQNVSVQPA